MAFTREQELEALHMNEADLRRHASVSTSNRHRCDSCFCCACVAELEKRQDVRDKIRDEIANNRDQWD